MANALFDWGRQGFLDGSINWSADTIKIMLVDLTIADVGVKQITSSSGTSPIVITSTAHGFANGDIVAISGHLTNTNANGNWTIQNVAANTFELTGSTFTAAGGATGRGVNLTISDFVDDVSAGRVGTDQTLGTKTVVFGVADAADPTFTAVTGNPVQALIIYKSTGTETTSRVISYHDTGTGIPVTPNGGDIIVQFDNTANRIFKL